MVTQLDRYNAAVNAFRGKFGALPGDFLNATSYISNTATNGNGDGIIALNSAIAGAVPAAVSGTSEYQGVWSHLSTLNLIDGVFSGAAEVLLGGSFPYTKANRGGVLLYGNTDLINYYHLGMSNAGTGVATIATQSILTPDGALSIDSKMDDGIPGTGIVQARGGAVIEGVATAGAAGTANCVNSTPTPNTYNTSAGAIFYCQLRVRM